LKKCSSKSTELWKVAYRREQSISRKLPKNNTKTATVNRRDCSPASHFLQHQTQGWLYVGGQATWTHPQHRDLPQRTHGPKRLAIRDDLLREISTEQEKTNAKEIKTRLFLVKRNLTAAQ
jgi:hypothetical protein